MGAGAGSDGRHPRDFVLTTSRQLGVSSPAGGNYGASPFDCRWARQSWPGRAVLSYPQGGVVTRSAKHTNERCNGARDGAGFRSRRRGGFISPRPSRSGVASMQRWTAATRRSAASRRFDSPPAECAQSPPPRPSPVKGEGEENTEKGPRIPSPRISARNSKSRSVTSGMRSKRGPFRHRATVLAFRALI
jgi:hypothetical protein